MPPTKKHKGIGRPRTRSTYQVDPLWTHIVTPPIYPSAPRMLTPKKKSGKENSRNPIIMQSGPSHSPISSRTIYTHSYSPHSLETGRNSTISPGHSLRASSSVSNTNNRSRPSYHERIFEPRQTTQISPSAQHTSRFPSPSVKSGASSIDNNTGHPYLRNPEYHHPLTATPQLHSNNQSYSHRPIRSIRIEGQITEWPTGISFVFPTLPGSLTCSPVTSAFQGGYDSEWEFGWDAGCGSRMYQDEDYHIRDYGSLRLGSLERDASSDGMSGRSDTGVPQQDSPSALAPIPQQSGTPIDTLTQPYRPKPYDFPYSIKDKQELQRARLRAHLEDKELVRRSIRGNGDVLIGGGDLRRALDIRQERQEVEMDVQDNRSTSTSTNSRASSSRGGVTPARGQYSTPRYITVQAESLPHICPTKCICCLRPSLAVSSEEAHHTNCDNSMADFEHGIWVNEISREVVDVIDLDKEPQGLTPLAEKPECDRLDDQEGVQTQELHLGPCGRIIEEGSRAAALSEIESHGHEMRSLENTPIPIEARVEAGMTDQAGIHEQITTEQAWKMELKEPIAFALNLGHHTKRKIEFVAEKGIETPKTGILLQLSTIQASSSSIPARIAPSSLKAQVDYPSPTPSPSIICRPLSPALTPPSSPRKPLSSFNSDTSPFISTEYIAHNLEPVYQDQVNTATILNRMEVELAMTDIWNRPAPPLDEAEWAIMVQCIRERKIRAETEKRRRKEAERLRQFTSARARMAKVRAETLVSGFDNHDNTSSLKRTASEETRLMVQGISDKRYPSRRWPSTVTTFAVRDRQVPIDSGTLSKDMPSDKAGERVREKRRPKPLTLLPAPPQHRLAILDSAMQGKVSGAVSNDTLVASDTESELTPLPEDEE